VFIGVDGSELRSVQLKDFHCIFYLCLILTIAVPMKSAIALILIIAIATSPVYAAMSRVQIESWMNACDLSQGYHDNCKSSRCSSALEWLVNADTRTAYEHLGMGSMSDLNEYKRLYDFCRLHSEDASIKTCTVNDTWTTNLLALKTYREIYGHVRVPKRFVVPRDDLRWPIDTRGRKIGNFVRCLRQRQGRLSQHQVNALDELGFAWGRPLDEIWIKKLLAINMYKRIHGDLRVPRRFIVPTNDQRWPIETHGMHLGNAVSDLRREKANLSQNQLNALEALGFVWGVSLDHTWRKKLLALNIFKDIHGHLCVPQRFVVPTDDQRWPIDTYGLNLGKVVSDLRHRKNGLPQNQLHALEALGFDWGLSHREKWRKQLMALTTFAQKYGHMRVPFHFIVPTDDPAWPEATHGVKLGRFVNYLHQEKDKLSPIQLNALDELGFVLIPSHDEKWRKNLLALTTFAEKYGHMRVPDRFIVPTDDDTWPEATHGMKLGMVVRNLRYRKDTLSQNQIDALNFFGFEWTVANK
jgi:hypothetical protein